VSCFSHALGLFRRLRDRYNEADVLVNLGETYPRGAGHDAAREAWQAALDIFSRT